MLPNVSPSSINYRPGGSSPSNHGTVVKRTLDLNLRSKKSRESLKWGIINTFLLSILIFDISNKCPFVFSNWYYVEYAITMILGLCCFYNFSKYFYYLISFEPIQGSCVEQRKLLNFNADDPSFLIKSNSLETPVSPVNQSNMSWHSFNDSKNISVPSPGWIMYRKNSPQNSFNQSFGQNMSNSSLNKTRASGGGNTSQSSFTSPYKNHSMDDLITDETALQQYLKEVSMHEENMNHSREQHKTINGTSLNSFWNHFKLDDVTGLLKTAAYQLSPTATSPNKQNSKDEGSFFNIKDLDGNSEILNKISTEKLSQYVANLRVWIASTIMKRIVTEINLIDIAFRTRGFSEIQIGAVGLERLKKTAENQQLVSLHVPMLPLIIPFLEISTNQTYLVQRIKDLAKGSCMADYRWNSGASYNGVNWDEHLPSDSAIIFNLFCTYMDSQLIPHPQPGGRPFYNRYIITTDNKRTQKETIADIKNKSKCAILCTNPIKPKFNFISENKIHNCVHDRNNLFYVIIQFLIYMKTHQEGFLEGVNLGRSGINLLCVIDN